MTEPQTLEEAQKTIEMLAKLVGVLQADLNAQRESARQREDELRQIALWLFKVTTQHVERALLRPQERGV